MDRTQLHSEVDRLLDRIEQDGRAPVGAALAIAHSGARDGLDHTTIETAVSTLHHPRMTTVLAGSVEVLRGAVQRLAILESNE